MNVRATQGQGQALFVGGSHDLAVRDVAMTDTAASALADMIFEEHPCSLSEVACGHVYVSGNVTPHLAPSDVCMLTSMGIASQFRKTLQTGVMRLLTGLGRNLCATLGEEGMLAGGKGPRSKSNMRGCSLTTTVPC
eukprot:667448-Amphidinium_carterae.1